VSDEDSAAAVTKRLTLQANVDDLTLRRNRKANAKAGWQKLLPPAFSLQRAVLVGGGPSVVKFVEAIKILRAEGCSVVTMNGTHDWCVQQGIYPNVHVALDARPANARFLTRPVPSCRYLICDSCHPEIFKVLPPTRTFIWDRDSLVGGSTVMLCAPPLLQKLGAKEFHFFGFDSCLLDEAHHAYRQPENDSMDILEVPIQERMFRVHPWMLQQAEEFLELSPQWGQISVYGEGLIAFLLREED
jgi:hypothetical protein